MIILENEKFRLEVNENCIVESLINKENGEECILPWVRLPLFSVTQNRPFNNEIKLSYMNKRTTFSANSLSINGTRLTVGFELLPYKAFVEVGIRERYITFTLAGFDAKAEDYPMAMEIPPAVEFNLCQIAVDAANTWGQWMNVCHTTASRIAVMATSPHTLCDSECVGNIRVMRSRALKDIKMCGCSAALIVSSADDFLSAVEDLEEDFDLPRGVKSRRSDLINASIYWTTDINPKNVEEHIECCKKGGFRLMLIFYPSLFKVNCYYDTYGDCEFNEKYPGGIDDVREVIDKIRAAGIIPGFHFLHTHIGVNSKYVTPKADPRLNLKKHFTLARELPAGDCDRVYVCEKPTGAPDMGGKSFRFGDMPKDADPYTCQLLCFGGEIISYTGFEEEYPYCFTGCKRGYHHTDITAHPAGEIGGVLDVNEYNGTSVYLNQLSDLGEEYSDKLKEIYDLGFGFVYFDGSEGTNPPYEYHVPNAQYRVYKKMKTPPIFCEGAAKAHFGWHMLSGANAFDIFPNDIFKEMIIKHPFTEAKVMKNDYTRVNFGWWSFNERTSPDLFEFGTSKAASCDCPMTTMFNLAVVKKNPRADDVMEVLRRWEDVRKIGWLTAERKEMLADADKEFTLLINETGDYELAECEQITVGNSGKVSAYVFTRKGNLYATVWDNEGESLLKLGKDIIISYSTDIAGEDIAYGIEEANAVLPVSAKAYLKLNCDKNTFIKAMHTAETVTK